MGHSGSSDGRLAGEPGNPACCWGMRSPRPVGRESRDRTCGPSQGASSPGSQAETGDGTSWRVSAPGVQLTCSWQPWGSRNKNTDQGERPFLPQHLFRALHASLTSCHMAKETCSQSPVSLSQSKALKGELRDPPLITTPTRDPFT